MFVARTSVQLGNQNRNGASLAQGQQGRIAAVASAAASVRLMELGLVPGTILRVVRRAPLGDPLEVEVNGARLALRAVEAAALTVEVVS